MFFDTLVGTEVPINDSEMQRFPERNAVTS